MATRTHTVYFADDSLKPVMIEIAKLMADLQSRRPYIAEKAADAMERRLDLLIIGVSLLAEPVPPSFE